jgi:glycosyltransferase involved in cell wall biosynthesis
VVFGKLAFYKKRQTSEVQPPVTVVITARNQYNDLKQNLPFLLEQDYPEFEIMVVNDNSDDGSDELLTDLSRQYNNLSIVDLKQSLNWFSGRKFPLSLGIKSARHELLILADTICRPVSKSWIKEIVSAHTPKTDIVLAYSTFDTNSKINLWFRFSAFYDGLFYLSMALAGKPFKGIGKNLSYQKQLFYSHKGFSSHYKINVGDDEIFINQTANKRNTNIQISQQSKVVVVKPVSLSSWLKSEKTRIFIRRFFKTGSRFFISLFNSTAFLFFASFVTLLVLGFNWMLVLPLFAVRLISLYVIFGLTAKKLTEKRLLLFSPLLEIFLILIDFIIWLVLIFSRKKRWA